jgi:hypothetical protein
VEDIEFWMDWKLGFKRKIRWALNVFTLLNLKNLNFEMWKLGNVFTLGPMTQATLGYNLYVDHCIQYMCNSYVDHIHIIFWKNIKKYYQLKLSLKYGKLKY